MARCSTLICVVLVVCLSGCRKMHSEFWTGKIINPPAAITYDKLVIQELKLDSINCSFEGMSGILSNRYIYYLDKYFGYIYKFDEHGRLLSKNLGVGRGPMETTIKHLAGHAFSEDDELVLYGTNVNFELFDSTLNAKKRFVTVFNPTEPKSDQFETYSYAWNNPVCRMYNHILYIGMQSECPTFNYLDQTESFLQDGYHIGRINLDGKKSMPMFLKGFPQLYHDRPNKYMSASFVNFDIDDKGTFYINFEADSLIYTYDTKCKSLIAFGHAGREMDLDYRPIFSWKEMDKHRANREDKGRYAWIEYVDATGLLFRSYCKGLDSVADGLQIYKRGALIGDVDVPKNFRVMGYISPYYYSQVFEDDESENLTIFRFEL